MSDDNTNDNAASPSEGSEHKGLDFDLGLTKTKTFTSSNGSTYHQIAKHAEGVIGIHNPGILSVPMANGITLLCVAIKVQFKGDNGCAETAKEVLSAYKGYSRGSERASSVIVVPIGICTGMDTAEVKRMSQEAMAQAIHAVYKELESKGCDTVDKEAITGYARACIGESLPAFEMKQVDQTPIPYQDVKKLACQLTKDFGLDGKGKPPTAGGNAPGMPKEGPEYDPEEDD